MTTVPEPGRPDSARVARLATLALLPVAPVSAYCVGSPILPVLLAALVFTGLALASAGLERRRQPLLLAVALVGQCIAFTAAFAGNSWQIDTHMLYFAVLAIVATMESLPALLLAVCLIAVHHLVFGLAMPALVFPAADVAEALGRVVFHAVVVLFEASVLAWWMINSARAAAEIRAARAALAESAERAAAARHSAEESRERAIAAAGRTRQEGQRAAAAVEQIAASARAAADGASHAQSVVARTKTDAERSGDVVHRAMTAMKAMEESSVEIGRIVTAIDEIARQTDLLALNAAVESARAGEAGRGFAVVATEVRALAQRSAEATQQIRKVVAQSSRQVLEGVRLVDETGGALGRIVGAVSDLNDLMTGIAAGAVQQSEGLAEVSIAITRIDSIADEDDSEHAEAGLHDPHFRAAA